MNNTQTAQLELKQQVNSTTAIFSVWIGLIFALISAGFFAGSLLSSQVALRQIVPLALLPGLVLLTSLGWKILKLSAIRGSHPTVELDHEFAGHVSNKARSWAFYATIFGGIVLFAVTINYDVIKSLNAVFHLSVIAAILFSSYGVIYLWLHHSSDTFSPAQ